MKMATNNNDSNYITRYKNVEDRVYGNGIPSAFYDIDSAINAAKKAGGSESDVSRGRVLFKYDAETEKLVSDFPDKFEKVAIVDKVTNQAVIIGTYKNAYTQLTGLANDTLPNGPYSMNGNPDGSVEIRNQKIYGKVYRKYTYRGGSGDLLNFKISSDFTTRVSAVSSSEITPEKTSETVMINTQGSAIKGEKLGIFNLVDVGKDDDSITGDGNYGPYTPEGTQDVSYWVNYDNLPNLDISKELLDLNQLDEYNSLPKYSSIKDAMASIQSQDVTADEWLDYFNKLNERISILTSKLDTSLSQQDLYIVLRESNNIPPYVVRRKVVIDGELICSEFAQNQSSPDIVNKSIEGYRYLKSKFGSDLIRVEYSRPTPNSYSGYSGISNSGSTLVPEKVYVNGIITLEVPIQGWRVLKSPSIKNVEISDVSDMVKSINDSVEASATVIGDPNLREGFVLNIQGVPPFSGDYYITKVVHNMSSSGYTCELTFQQRDIEISQSTIKVGVDLKKSYIELHQWVVDNYDTFDKGIITEGIPSYLKTAIKIAKETFKENDSVIYGVKDGELNYTIVDGGVSSIPVIDCTKDFNRY